MEITLATGLGLGKLGTNLLAIALGVLREFVLEIVPWLQIYYGMARAARLILVTKGLSIAVMERTDVVVQSQLHMVKESHLADPMFWFGMAVALGAGFPVNIHNAELRMDGSKALAEMVKWAIRLPVLVVAFDALGLLVPQKFLTWLPDLVVALIVLAAAGLATNPLARIVRGVAAGARLGNPDLIASLARVTV